MTTRQGRRLTVQANAVRGFSAWLDSSPGRTQEEREHNEQLLYVFQTYREELERQINGEKATQDWLNILAISSTLAALLKDEVLETNPELSEYRPSDEPMTIDEMILRLLSDAIDHFEKCGRSEALAPITDLVQRAVNTHTS